MKSEMVGRAENLFRAMFGTVMMSVISHNAIFARNRTEVPKSCSVAFTFGRLRLAPNLDFMHKIRAILCTAVPVMNGHPRDQAKVSVHDRWPLVGGTGGRRQT